MAWMPYETAAGLGKLVVARDPCATEVDWMGKILRDRPKTEKRFATACKTGKLTEILKEGFKNSDVFPCSGNLPRFYVRELERRRALLDECRKKKGAPRAGPMFQPARVLVQLGPEEEEPGQIKVTAGMGGGTKAALIIGGIVVLVLGGVALARRRS